MRLSLDRPGFLGLAATAAAAALLLLFSLYAMYSAGRLQARLDTDEALAAARVALDTPLRTRHAGEAGRALEALIHHPRYGFKYLALRDPDGGVLAVAGGVYERLNRLPPALGRQLREALYALTAQLGEERWVEAGQPVGTLEYAISDSVLRQVRDEAVARLWWTGVVGLLLGLPMLGGAALALRRGPAPAPDWTRRLEPMRPAAPAASAAQPQAPSADPLQRRVGAALDELGRAVIVIDREGRVRHFNAAAEALTGWSATDANTRLVYTVFHPLNENGEPLLTPAESCLHDQPRYPPTECRLRARDGRERPIEVMAARLTDAEGLTEGAVMYFHDISERRAITEARERSSRLTQGVIDHLVEGVLTTDLAGVIRFANARALRMFGYSREDLEGVTITKLMPVPFLNSPGIKLSDYIAAKHGPKLPKVVGWRKDATTFPVELVVEPMRLEHEGQEDEGLVIILRDITDRMKSDNLTLRLGRLLDNASEEVYIFDAQSLYYLEVNRGAQRNLGYRPDQLARMTPLTIAVGLDAETFQDYLARLRGGEQDHLVYRCSHQRADGSTYPVEVRLNFSRDEEPPVFMAIASNVSERQATEERLQFLAHHDALTGLPNRTVLSDRLQQALLTAGRSGRGVAAMFVDLDRFKQINDTLGHETGDAVLKQVAERLQEGLRASDTVARLGGDEFVVVAGGVRGIEDAEQLAQKLAGRFTAPFEVAGRQLELHASIGLTVFPYDNTDDAETLLQHADAAMYEAKQAGRGVVRTYRPDVSPARERELILSRDVHSALALSQYEMRYAPVIEARTGSVRALFASFVWRHARFGEIDAEEARDVAQRARLSPELELWLLRSVCQTLAHNNAVPVIAELSAGQLRDTTLRERVPELLQRYPLPPRKLILTLTEDGLTEARESAAEQIAFLRDRGVRFGLRGLGASGSGGFAGLNRLGQMVELVTLSERLVAVLPQGREAASLARSIIGTAVGLHLKVLAPGVQSPEARSYLESQGCSLMGGPAVHEAVGPDALTALLVGKAVDAL